MAPPPMWQMPARNAVSAIDTATRSVVATIAVGHNPVDVSITPDGTQAYVTNAGSNTVSVINTGTNAMSTTVTVGSNPVSATTF
jgi:YVTN family beta-propeller protein